MSPFLTRSPWSTEHLDDDPGDRGVDLAPLLGQQRAVALDRQRAGDERHGPATKTRIAGEHRGDLGQGPAAEHPPGRAHRLEHAASGRSCDVPGRSRAPSRRAARRPRSGRACRSAPARRRSARPPGSRTATFSLLLSVSCRSVSGLCRSVTHDDLRARLVDVHLEGVADVGGEAVGVAGVDQVFARADHDLAEPGQLADQVGPLLDDFLAADRLDHRPAGDLQARR